jgi:nitroreductase
MTFREAVEGRCSVRTFTGAPVPRDDVREIVRLATRAASAANAQMWRFVAVESDDVRGRMRRAVDDRIAAMEAWPEVAEERRRVRSLRRSTLFFAEAPLVIAVLALPYRGTADRLLSLRGMSREECERLRQRPDLQSVGAAVQLLITAAYTLGYGACWMSAPILAADALEAILGVEPPASLVALVPVGRPAGRLRRSKRLPVDDVLRFV